jgi:hypothetical protein
MQLRKFPICRLCTPLASADRANAQTSIPPRTQGQGPEIAATFGISEQVKPTGGSDGSQTGRERLEDAPTTSARAVGAPHGGQGEVLEWRAFEQNRDVL